jgi:hypothetical protein
MLFVHCARLAASRADCTAGNNSATNTPMIEMTTNNSINVNPLRRGVLKGVPPGKASQAGDFSQLRQSLNWEDQNIPNRDPTQA